MKAKTRSTGIDVVEFLKKLLRSGPKQVVVRFEEDLHYDSDIFVSIKPVKDHYPLKFRRVDGIYPELTWFINQGALRVCKVSIGYKRMKSEVIIHVV